MKRKRKSASTQVPNKRPKLNEPHPIHPGAPLLRQYYPQVTTLRAYLVSALPKTSKKRRRNLQNYGRGLIDEGTSTSTVDHGLAYLLDHAVVGSSEVADADVEESVLEDLTVFTQQVSDGSGTVASSSGVLQQAEVGAGFAVLRVGGFADCRWLLDCRFCYLDGFSQERCCFEAAAYAL